MPFKTKFITGFNEQGIYLNESDLTMLLFLYEHKILSQRQLYEFFTLISGNEKYNYNSFCNRLNKLEKLNIVGRTRYELVRRNGIYMNLVHLEKQGIDILYFTGYLENNITQRIPKTNIEHTLGIKQSVIEAYKVISKGFGFAIAVNSSRDNSGGISNYLYVIDKEKAFNWAMIKDDPKNEVLYLYASEEFGDNPVLPRQRPESNLIQDYKSVVLTSYSGILNYYRDRFEFEDDKFYPDWMITQNRNTFDIEFDTGSEKFETILGKIDKYIELDNMDTQKHTVFLITADDSISMRNISGIQNSRMSALKKLIMYGRVNDKEKTPQHVALRGKELDVYIFPLGRTAAIYKKVMLGDYMKSEEEVLSEFYNQNKERFKMVQLDNREMFIKNGILLNLDHYELTTAFLCNSQDTTVRVLPVQLKEGDLKSMDKFGHLIKKVKELNKIFPVETTKVIGIYKTKDELINDIVSLDVIEENTITNQSIIYCLEDQKFYDILNKNEVESPFSNP